MLTKESPSVVTVVLDLSDGLGESVTMAILAATDSMTADVDWTSVKCQRFTLGWQIFKV